MNFNQSEQQQHGPAAQESTRSYGSALAVISSVFFMWGFVTVLNDILVPHLKAIFALNYTETMLIQFTFFSAYFLMSMPAAKVISWIGFHHSIALGLGVMGLGALMFLPAASIPSYGVFLSGLFVVASGMTLLQVSANPYVAVLGPPEGASSRLNLAQALNSLGTTLGPWIGGYLILSADHRHQRNRRHDSGADSGAQTGGGFHGDRALRGNRHSARLAGGCHCAGFACRLFLQSKIPAITPTWRATAPGDIARWCWGPWAYLFMWARKWPSAVSW